MSGRAKLRDLLVTYFIERWGFLEPIPKETHYMLHQVGLTRPDNHIGSSTNNIRNTIPDFAILWVRG